MYVCGSQGIANVQKLSEYLGYKSPEKLYRLERDQNAKPSFAVLVDIANKFESIDMNWLITGEGEMIYKNESPAENEDDFNRVFRALTRIIVELGELREDVKDIKIKTDSTRQSNG